MLSLHRGPIPAVWPFKYRRKAVVRRTEAKSWLKRGVRRFWLKQFRSTTDCDFCFINQFCFFFFLFDCLFVVVVVWGGVIFLHYVCDL